jgi:hypothetical protein
MTIQIKRVQRNLHVYRGEDELLVEEAGGITFAYDISA